MSLRNPRSQILILFLSVSAAALLMAGPLRSAGFQTEVLLLGNLFLFLLTMVSLRLLTDAMKASDTAGFLRSFYASFLMKFILVAAVAFAYISTNRGNIDKSSLFTCMFLYLVYVFLETRVVLSSSKKKEDGRD